jgi:hypothetical protein
MPQTNRTPGVDFAEGMSQITGTAVSPLLGVTVLGAWRYFRTPEERRAQLPWFSKPLVWVGGCLLLFLCLLKDTVGAVVPQVIKKSFDVADALENKISAALACAVFVPFVAREMALGQEFPGFAIASNVRVASMSQGIAFDLSLLLVLAAMLVFAVVWLSSHAINVLILLSPFRIVDAGLKALKLFLVSSIIACAAIAPWLGAVVSLLIIGGAWLLAPWAFRLTVFGTLLSLDVFLPWVSRRNASPDDPRVFLAHALEKVPVRTYGRLVRSASGIEFKYRPWMVFSERRVVLPSENAVISKGLLYPSLAAVVEDRKSRTVLVFRRCHRTQVNAIAANLEIAEVRESLLVSGFRSAWAWMTDIVNVGGRRLAITPPPS